jgi:hypothetical protein
MVPRSTRGHKLAGASALWTVRACRPALIGEGMTHKFRPGQTVRLCRGLASRSAPGGDFKVVRQLPNGDGEPQYRIKSVREPCERVAKESDIEKV